MRGKHKLLVVAAFVIIVWAIYRTVVHASIVPLKGYSTYNTNPLPAAGIHDRSSGLMGMRTY